MENNCIFLALHFTKFVHFVFNNKASVRITVSYFGTNFASIDIKACDCCCCLFISIIIICCCYCCCFVMVENSFSCCSFLSFSLCDTLSRSFSLSCNSCSLSCISTDALSFKYSTASPVRTLSTLSLGRC